MAVKNYTDVFNIKKMYMEDIAPKYFNVDEINTLNVGLFGQVNDILATTTEDVYNVVATYINELIPVRAVMPESIYGYATTVQLDNLFARAAETTGVLYINKRDIISEKTKNGDHYVFHLDKDCEIFVEDKKFMLDYDIEIIAKPVADKFIFNARYLLDHRNVISSIKNPYIRSMEIKYSGGQYLALVVVLHQMERNYKEENIINNTILNMPILNFDFEDKQLAGFNVFYLDNITQQKVQLELKLLNTPPSKNPFCYYKFKNDHTIEISFTTKDFYFKPELNSNLFIEYFTTLGSKGVFKKYTGSGGDITCIPKSDKWEYNNNLTVFCTIESASQFGADMPTLEQIKALYIEKMTTVESYTSDEDLNLYFENFNFMNNSITRFIKTRDDFRRVYTGFGILRNQHDEVYHTNTLTTTIEPSNFDVSENDNILILKPGRLFTYKDTTTISEVTLQPKTKTLKDDFSDLVESDTFVYSTPFLILVTKKPGSVGYYLNSVNKSIITNYTYVNSDSIAQFICNNFTIERNAYLGSDKYTISINLLPSSELEEDVVGSSGEDLGVIKPKIIIYGENDEVICYNDFTLSKYDKSTNITTFTCDIQTDDYMTISRKFRVKNCKKYSTGEVEEKFIPINDCKVEIAVFYKSAGINISHSHKIPGTEGYTLTNIYTTVDELVNWITPLPIMNSYFTFNDAPGTPGKYTTTIRHIPMVRATTLKEPETSKDILSRIDTHIRYTLKALSKITNNYSVDIKFYNTFGRSRALTIGEENTKLLDKVNLSIELLVKPTVNAPTLELVRDIKIHIKKFIEEINSGIFNRFHVSNLIQSIENTFPDVDYLTFKRINNYDTFQQTIQSKHKNIEEMTKSEKAEFIPEFLTIRAEDIIITII